MTGGQENQAARPGQAPNSNIYEDIFHALPVIRAQACQRSATLANGKMSQEAVDMITRVLGLQMPGSMQLVDEVTAVMVIIGSLMGLNEALVEIADVGREYGKLGSEVVVMDIKHASYKG